MSTEQRRQAFGRLAREHLATVYGLARRLTGSPEDAEDLVQETFLKAWRGLGRFRRESDLRTWLYRILVNASHDHHRRRQRERRRQPPPKAAASNPAERPAGRELVDRVLDAVTQLPRRQCECLLLRARGGLSYREIAELLGIQEGVVKLHLIEGRRTLLRRFGEEVKEWGIKNT